MAEYKLKIMPDSDAESPREWDNLGTMACWHSRYNLGDGGGREKLLDAVRNSKRYTEAWEDEYDDRNYRNLSDPSTLINTAYDCGIIMLPLYLYDHSGITMNTTGFSCRWDSGQVGVIFVTPEDARSNYGWARITQKRHDAVLQSLKAEVEVYDQFLRGEVYGFQLEVDGKEANSCFGFYGSDPEDNGMQDYLPVPVAQVEVCHVYA